MSWSDFDKNYTVPQEAVHAMLDLLDRIQYAYLQIDGTYSNLHPVVSDKVKYIEKLLYNEMEKEADTCERTNT